MKNRPVMDKLRTQEREQNTHEIFFVGEKKKIVDAKTDKNIKTILDTSIQQQTSLTVIQSIHQQTDNSNLYSFLSILPSVTEIKPTDEQQLLKHKKKKKRRPRLS